MALTLSASPEFCSGLVEDYNPAEEPQQPHGVKTAIFGLLLFSGNLSCNNCGTAFQTKTSILRHLKENPSCTSSSYQMRPTQIYFPNSQRLLFGVTVPPTPSTKHSKDLSLLIKEIYSPLPFSAIPIKPATSFHDANHFLRVEQWEHHVEGMTGTQIQAVVREREPEQRKIIKPVVEAYARCMVEELTRTDHAVKVAIGDYNG